MRHSSENDPASYMNPINLLHRMEFETPTFHSLNKPQKRALILRDQLRYTEPHHLDTFMDGITDDEPPTYRTINGTTYPPLALVTLKDNATRFDLGNVFSPEESNAVHHVYLTVEDGQIEMRLVDALPEDEASLDSVPIHEFIARTMVPMFKSKFQAIIARQNKINDARRMAYKMASLPVEDFTKSKSLARLDPVEIDEDDSCHNQPTKKRKRSKEITKHCSNKGKSLGLDAIPDAVKSASFDPIPEQIKVDLFNTIVKTAFPNFDNLIMAASNVVSVYAAVGTDFPALHKAVSELKNMLEEFDEGMEGRKKKASLKYRAELESHARSGNLLLCSPVADAMQHRERNAHGRDGAAADRAVFVRDDSHSQDDGQCEGRVDMQRNVRKQMSRLIGNTMDNKDESDSEIQGPFSPFVCRTSRGKMSRTDSNYAKSSIPWLTSPGPLAAPKVSNRDLEKSRLSHQKRVEEAHAVSVMNVSHYDYPKTRLYSSEDVLPKGKKRKSKISCTRMTIEGPTDQFSTDKKNGSSRDRHDSSADNMATQLLHEYLDQQARMIHTNISPGKESVRKSKQGQKFEYLARGMKSEERRAVAHPNSNGGVESRHHTIFQSIDRPNVDLGCSMLGARKQMGTAPVAPMVHTTRGAGLRNCSGVDDGAVRRAY